MSCPCTEHEANLVMRLPLVLPRESWKEDRGAVLHYLFLWALPLGPRCAAGVRVGSTQFSLSVSRFCWDSMWEHRGPGLSWYFPLTGWLSSSYSWGYPQSASQITHPVFLPTSLTSFFFLKGRMYIHMESIGVLKKLNKYLIKAFWLIHI